MRSYQFLRKTALVALVLLLGAPGAADITLPRTDDLLSPARCSTIQKKYANSLYSEFLSYAKRLRAPKAQIKALYGVYLNFSFAERKQIQQYAGAPGDAAQFARIQALINANVAARKLEYDKVVCPRVEEVVPRQPKSPPHDWWDHAPPRDPYYYSRYQIRAVDGACVLSLMGSDGEYHPSKSFPIVRSTTLEGPSAEDMRRGSFVVTYSISGHRDSVAKMDLASGKMTWMNPAEQEIYGEKRMAPAQIRELADTLAAQQLAQAYPECAATGIK